MKATQIRKKFLDFFVKNGHKFVTPISLIPENDPSLLFTNSGMVQFKDYFLGLAKPPNDKMVNYQPCFRTIDLEKVGTNDRTLTFFEMLGSWSINSYGKEEAIRLAWTLLTEEFGFNKNKLWVTVFGGSDNIPADQESIGYWKKMGLVDQQIVRLGEKDNFWIAGETGPCGPSTEIYYDQGKNVGCGEKDCQPGCDCDRFLEVWNAGVFMQYERIAKRQASSAKRDKKKSISDKQDAISRYKYLPLKIKSVDTGAGLERLAVVLQDKDSVFETDIFQPIMKKLYQEIPSRTGNKQKAYKSLRIVADHIRGAVFLAADRVIPSNKTQGYVMRRLIRRMIIHGWLLGLKEQFIADLAKNVIDSMKEYYPNLGKEKKNIVQILTKEEANFSQTLDKGIKELNKILAQKPQEISGQQAFLLYDSYGFPLELTVELASEKGLKVDQENFKELMSLQQERARASQQFGDKIINPRLHTATHLLHQALINTLGSHIEQAGSDVSGQELRFDFTHHSKLSEEEKKKVEEEVNQQIKKSLPVKMWETTLSGAKKYGAKMLFRHKYTEKVKFYYIGQDLDSAYSKELCGGPHAANTKELGKFVITGEKSSSSGIRRIKAVLK